MCLIVTFELLRTLLLGLYLRKLLIHTMIPLILFIQAFSCSVNNFTVSLVNQPGGTVIFLLLLLPLRGSILYSICIFYLQKETLRQHLNFQPCTRHLLLFRAPYRLKLDLGNTES